MADSLSTLRTRAQARGDFENDSNVSTAAWNAYINAGYKALWRLLTRAHPDHFTTGPTSIVLTGTTDTYALSSLSPTFWKLRAVDWSNGGDWQQLRRFQFEERNRVRRAYRIMGSKIQFTPMAAAAGTYRLWYIQAPTALSADIDVIDDAVDMYNDYIVVDAAIRARKRQRKDAADLVAELADLVKDIRASAGDRDEGEPERVTDTSTQIWPDQLPGPL